MAGEEIQGISGICELCMIPATSADIFFWTVSMEFVLVVTAFVP
jgi:hypothetical protein